jgi:serine/threonine-protein kinase
MSHWPTDLAADLQRRYVFERELGRGGMGAVYLARDLRHDRPVALKILLPELAAGSGAERFEREIRFAARLQHPHILTVLDSGISGGGDSAVRQLWYTMPFVEGESLRDRLTRERRLPLDVALRITAEAARALDYAHQEGVIHRDVKPENILLTRDGTTLVTDFGVARGVERSVAGLTTTGSVMGTPAYMSPEQLDEQEVDARTDQYSLAAVLYEMLAGEPPFSGRSVHAIVAKRISDPTPSVRVRGAEVPASVDEAIRKAMAVEPAQRFASVAQFANALAEGQRGGAAGARRSWRRFGLPIAGVVAGLFFLGLGLRALRPPLRPSAPRPTPVIAVLPFDNLGDSADAYFADGVADEIRAKLAQVGGLEVIARGSSLEYRRTERPTAIARELGADYLLTGTVRWEKAAAGHRVRVLPELVDARSGQAARTRWVQQFDASLTDVFQVQADIAARVAGALGVVLADSTRRELRLRPTENLAAYDEFLKGEAAAQGMKADQAGLRRAIAFYERAVAFDSTFVHAWSQLSRARTSLYSNGVPSPELGEQARLAAERARTLRPNDPSVFLALGDYYGNVNPIDNERATAAFEEGLRLAPDNVDLLGAAAMTETGLGRWDGAPARLARASLLDPRSASAARRLAAVQIFLRNHAAADSAADRAIALSPTSPAMVSLKLLVAVARGDVDGARAVIRAAEGRIDPGALLAFFSSYQDLYWLLDERQQKQVLAAPPSAFDEDRGVWGLVMTQIYHDRGDHRRARAYADSARLALEDQVRAAPDDGQRRELLGLALAFLGRKADAVREGKRGAALMPISRDGYLGPYVQLQLARIYILTGEPDRALDQLEPLLSVPFYLTPAWLRNDPAFKPLRDRPRFRALVSGGTSVSADTVVVRSGELALRGLLWTPPGAGPFPGILFNHGSYTAGDTTTWNESAALGPIFAAHGYVLLVVFRRGVGLSADQGVADGDLMAKALATGSPELRNDVQLDLLQGEELNEAAAGLAALRTYPRVDPGRVGLAGHSFGGSLAVLLAARDTGVRATAVFGAAARSWSSSPALRALLLEAVHRGAPALFLHAANDYSVSSGKALAAEMQRLKRPHRLRIYPPVGRNAREGHNLIYRDMALWEADVFEFLDYYLLAGG